MFSSRDSLAKLLLLSAMLFVVQAHMGHFVSQMNKVNGTRERETLTNIVDNGNSFFINFNLTILATAAEIVKILHAVKDSKRCEILSC